MAAIARVAALQSLQQLRTGPAELAAVLERERRRLADPRDRALATEIVLGTTRWRAALDCAIAWAGGRSVEEFDAVVLDVLRMTAYQLLHLDRVPAAAAVDDAVDLCRQKGHPRAARAVNAVLRRISRERARLPLPTPDDPLACLSVTWSHPSWLAARWLARMGFDTALEWVRFNNSPAPLTLRANTLVATPESLAAALGRAGVVTRPCRFARDGLVVESGHPLGTSLAAEGMFVAQDEASQLVGAFAACSAHGRVLDACASPGGKTIQLASALGGRGFLVAGELRPRRIRLLRETLAAARLGAIAVIRHDLLGGLPFGPVFDCVVVDAPCSSLGTIRRDPDVRWVRHEGDLASFAGRQRRMLASAASGVGPGGCLVYATCSSEPEENEDVVDAFLALVRDFTLEDPRAANAPIDPGLGACLDAHGCLRTTPHQHGLGAFFAARLRRRS